MVSGPIVRMSEMGGYLGIKKVKIQQGQSIFDLLAELLEEWGRYLKFNLEITLSGFTLRDETLDDVKVHVTLEGNKGLWLEVTPLFSLNAIYLAVGNQNDQLKFWEDMIKLQESMKQCRLLLKPNSLLTVQSWLDLEHLNLETFAKARHQAIDHYLNLRQFIENKCGTLEGILK